MSNIGGVERRTIEEYMAAQAQSSGGSNSLGQKEFLNLLVAQLQHQDPLEPAKDTEFIAQLAQFSSLEELQTLNTNVVNQSAYAYVGKYVIVEMPVKQEDGTTALQEVSGRVQGVYIDKSSGAVSLSVNGEKVDPSQVVCIIDNELIEDQQMLNSILQGATLVGKYVTAAWAEDGEDKQAEGYITKTFVDGGYLNVIIDGKTTIKVQNIKSIENSAPVKETDDPEAEADEDAEVDEVE